VNICVQDDKGATLGPNVDGEVCARGGNFMREYWNRPAETAEAFRGGWYHTGDGGHIAAAPMILTSMNLREP